MTAGLALIGVSGYVDSTTMLYAVLPVAVLGFSAVTPSLVHWKLAPASSDENSNVALCAVVSAAGFPVIVACGAVVSIVHE